MPMSFCCFDRVRVAIRVSIAVIAASLDFNPALAGPVTIEWSTVVSSTGNAPDPLTGFGSVNREYRIGKYEVTIGQYTAFLNAVDPNGMNPYGLYNPSMHTDGNIRGILYSTGSASGSKYSPIGSVTRPITYVSWFDAARFANWMQNGQGSGSTETGAYTLVDGQTSGEAPARNPGATIYIPTENEWYKAAYYSPLLNSGAGGYWAYATQSNDPPGNTIGSEGNQSNYFVGGYAVTQSSSYDLNQNYLTDVGAFTESASHYGTYDQTGNVFEWSDGDAQFLSPRILRGGGWDLGGAHSGSAGNRVLNSLTVEASGLGFRLAVAVPEPSTYAMALVGLACGGFTMWRLRKRV